MQLLKSAKKLLRPQSQRLVLEPRIVFDAVLPVMGAEVIELTDQQAAPEANEVEVTPAFQLFSATDSQASENEIATSSDRALIEGTLAPTNLTAKEIIFIDAVVADLQQYITNYPNADVVLLDASKDGVAQIAAALAGRTGIESVHIISHGGSGQLTLGCRSLVSFTQFHAWFGLVRDARERIVCDPMQGKWRIYLCA